MLLLMHLYHLVMLFLFIMFFYFFYLLCFLSISKSEPYTRNCEDEYCGQSSNGQVTCFKESICTINCNGKYSCSSHNNDPFEIHCGKNEDCESCTIHCDG
eukprot:293483_1